MSKLPMYLPGYGMIDEEFVERFLSSFLEPHKQIKYEEIQDWISPAKPPNFKKRNWSQIRKLYE